MEVDILEDGSAVRCDVPIDDIVNTWSAETLLEWTRNHPRNAADVH